VVLARAWLHGLEACNKRVVVLARAWLHGLEACNKRVVVLARAWLHGLEACNIGLWFLQELGCTVWKPATKGSGSSNSLVARFGSLQQRVLVLATAWLHGLEAFNTGFWCLQELGCTVWKPATKGSGSSNSLVAQFGSLQQRDLVLPTAWLHGLEACNKGFWSLQQLGCTVWKPATKGSGSSNSLVARFGFQHGGLVNYDGVRSFLSLVRIRTPRNRNRFSGQNQKALKQNRPCSSGSETRKGTETTGTILIKYVRTVGVNPPPLVNKKLKVTPHEVHRYIKLTFGFHRMKSKSPFPCFLSNYYYHVRHAALTYSKKPTL